MGSDIHMGTAAGWRRRVDWICACTVDFDILKIRTHTAGLAGMLMHRAAATQPHNDLVTWQPFCLNHTRLLPTQTPHTCNASEKSDSFKGRILSKLALAMAAPSSRTGPKAASLHSAVRSLAL